MKEQKDESESETQLMYDENEIETEIGGANDDHEYFETLTFSLS